MDDTVGLQKCVSGLHFPDLVPDREAEASRRDIGDLGMRVGMHGADPAFFKVVYDTHGVVAVGHDAACDTLAAGLKFNLIRRDPAGVFVERIHHSYIPPVFPDSWK